MGSSRSLRRLLAYYINHAEKGVEKGARKTDQNRPKPTDQDADESADFSDLGESEPFLQNDHDNLLAGRVGAFSAPTLSLSTLKEWSGKYDWPRRTTIFNFAWEEEKNARREAEVESGFSLDYVRVRALKKMAALIEEQLFEKSDALDNSSSPLRHAKSRRFHNLWVPDKKTVGAGENAEIVDYEKFNGALLSQWRGLLGEIAKETGGRVPLANIGAFLKKLYDQLDFDKFTPAQMSRIQNGDAMEWLLVVAEPFMLAQEDDDDVPGGAGAGMGLVAPGGVASGAGGVAPGGAS